MAKRKMPSVEDVMRSFCSKDKTREMLLNPWWVASWPDAPGFYSGMKNGFIVSADGARMLMVKATERPVWCLDDVGKPNVKQAIAKAPFKHYMHFSEQDRQNLIAIERNWKADCALNRQGKVLLGNEYDQLTMAGTHCRASSDLQPFVELKGPVQGTACSRYSRTKTKAYYGLDLKLLAPALALFGAEPEHTLSCGDADGCGPWVIRGHAPAPLYAEIVFTIMPKAVWEVK